MQDKFNVIEDHINKTESSVETFENYCENYLHNNKHILLHDYIIQLTHFNNIEYDKLYIIIEKSITNYLIFSRTNIRNSIKKNKFTIYSGLFDFLNSFKEKCKFLYSLTHTNQIANNTLNELVHIILYDPFIKQIIEESILNNISMKEIYKLLKSITNKNSILSHNFITIISQIYKKKISDITITNNPIESLQSIIICNKIIHEIQNINKLNKFLDTDLHLLLSPLNQYLITYLCVILSDTDNIYQICALFFNKRNYILSIINSTPINSVYNNGYLLRMKLIEYVNNMLKNNNVDIDSLLKISLFISKLESNHCSGCLKSIFSKNVLSDNMLNKLCDILGQYTLEHHDKSYIIGSYIIKFDNIEHIIKTSNADINEYIVLLVKILSLYPNQDVMMMIYNKQLSKRLLHNITHMDNTKWNGYIVSELNIINNFEKACIHNNCLYQTKKFINDINTSYNMNNTIKEKLDIFFLKCNMAIISCNWPINFKEGAVSSTSIIEHNHVINIKNHLSKTLTNQLCYYEMYYCSKYNKRAITWFPHFGEIDIVFMDKEVKLLPIQLLVLEMFNDNEILPLNKIMELKILANYNLKFKNALIESLLQSKIIKMQGNMLIITSKNTFETNLIKIFNELYNVIALDIIEEQHIVHTRNEVIITNVNSIVKKKNINFEDLYEKTKMSIKHFILSQEQFKEALNIMLDKEYIVCNDDVYKTVLF